MEKWGARGVRGGGGRGRQGVVFVVVTRELDGLAVDNEVGELLGDLATLLLVVREVELFSQLHVKHLDRGGAETHGYLNPCFNYFSTFSPILILEKTTVGLLFFGGLAFTGQLSYYLAQWSMFKGRRRQVPFLCSGWRCLLSSTSWASHHRGGPPCHLRTLHQACPQGCCLREYQKSSRNAQKMSFFPRTLPSHSTLSS